MSASPKNLPEFLQNHHFSGQGNHGSRISPSLWLSGVEYGESEKGDPTDEEIKEYSVALQKTWTYNRNAFKLISVIEGQPVENALAYAEQQKIFESKTAPYFQTNLFPIECKTLDTWSDDAQLRTGFSSKEEYVEAVRSNCFALMHEQILALKPRLFIGVGTTHVADFTRVVLGKPLDIEATIINIGGNNKKIYVQKGEIPFAVVPTLSGWPSGLNTDEEITKAGEIIRSILN